MISFQLGIQRLFTANSQITKLIQSGQGKSVSSANQKSAISIDESGTVAASVTSIGVNTLSLPSPSELFILRLTEPFLAILVDKKNKVPLMITKIYEPWISTQSFGESINSVDIWFFYNFVWNYIWIYKNIFIINKTMCNE